jgi:hypothetical protein
MFRAFQAVNRTRRTLIKGVVACLAGDPAGVLGWVGRRAGGLVARLAPTPAESAEPTLSRAEIEDLLAFAEVVVGGGSLPADGRSYLVDHIQQRARPGEYYLGLYRTAATLLGRLAGARFSTLEVDQRIALVTRHQLVLTDERKGDSPDPFPGDTLAVRTRAVPDLIGAYYRSPAGWAVVGYDGFPGKCGDLARYTGPER